MDRGCLPISHNPFSSNNSPNGISPNPRVRVGWLGSELGLGLGFGLGWGLVLGLGLGLRHALRHDELSPSVSNNCVHVRRIGIRRNGAEPDHDNDVRTMKRDPRNAYALGRSKLRSNLQYRAITTKSPLHGIAN